MSAHLTISATEFKAKCLDIFTQLADRRLSGVTVTRRGKPVAEVERPKSAVGSLYGSMAGSVYIAPGVDITAPVIDFDEDAFERKFADLWDGSKA